ncbi:ABC transporter permease [Ochrobactrum sp. MYb379]|uniref:ABC transporter permease n=1 Tax=Ochrobactrum sp. MYb379 TaxID=2745275 RepID=UPI0030A3CE98
MISKRYVVSSRSSQRPPLGLVLVVMGISVLMLIPLAYIAIRTSNVGMDRAVALLFRERTWSLLGNTMILAILVSLISVSVGTCSALLLERYRIRGRQFFSLTITLPLCIPAFVSSFSWLSLSFRFSGLAGSVLVMSMVSIPLAYLPVAAVLRRIDISLEEVSFSLGRSRVFTFCHAVLPQLRPALGSGFLLISLHLLVEFGAVSILNYPTFTTAIFQEYDMAFDNATAALLSLVLAFICLVIVVGEFFIRGNEELSRRGRGVATQPVPRELPGVLHILAVLFFLIQFGVGVIIPGAVVVYRTAMGSSLQTKFAFWELADSIGLTMGISLVGALVTLLVAAPLVWCSVRYRSLLTLWIDRLPFLLHALPGIVIALALTYFSIHYARPFYQTFVPVLLAYLMLFLPMAQTALRASFLIIPKAVEDVGYSLGRSRAFVFRTLVVPAMLPGIAAAFSLVFLNMTKELTATLVLTPTTVPTVAVSVWELTQDGSYGAVGPYALAHILFSGIPVFFVRKYAFH